MRSKRKFLALGLGVATVATVGVTSTLAANAATISGPYRMEIPIGQDISASANANCGPRAQFLRDVYIESTNVEAGTVVIVYTCESPER